MGSLLIALKDNNEILDLRKKLPRHLDELSLVLDGDHEIDCLVDLESLGVQFLVRTECDKQSWGGWAGLDVKVWLEHAETKLGGESLEGHAVYARQLRSLE